MINVLVVEDSTVVREYLVHLLSSDPEIKVLGTATNGEEALEFLRRKKPDVITMDIHMPKMNGLDATRKIMETHPVPIVIVSGSSSSEEVTTTFQAMEAGAVAVAPRPRGIRHPEYDAMAEQLLQTVKLLSEVRVVRRWGRRRVEPAAPLRPPLEIRQAPAEVRAVAIGASTGGPAVLHTILSALPKDFPAPLLIVQHMAPGFVHGFVEWLSQGTRLLVRVPVQGEPILPGHAYVAPDGYHLGVDQRGRAVLAKEASENGMRPSVSYLFRSVAEVYGRGAIAVLLSGMGKDGAEELKLIKDKQGITIAQDKESSVVHGMPGEAILLGAADYVLSGDKIADALQALVGGGSRRGSR